MKNNLNAEHLNAERGSWNAEKKADCNSALRRFHLPSSIFHVLALISALGVPRSAFSQTSVLFPLAQMTGTTNDTILTVRPVNNPVKFHSAVYWLPTAGIQLATKNGSATTNLIPNDYNVTIAGVPGSWKISVSDTNVTLNAAEIGNLTVYSANTPLPGVAKINAGANITISPPNGMGVVTINATGGGGSATNAYQVQAGNRLITIATNLTDLIYTISGVSQTNGYPWGVLYDAAGAAQAATNGWPWGALYDAAGAAQAATNGISLASGLAAFRNTNSFDRAGAASAATNGFPWGALYDAIGTAQAATNGLSLASGLAAFRSTNSFDFAGSASAATNGFPWGVMYDAAGSATAATNGWPWSVLYDAAGAAQAATNEISLASGLAAFRSTNSFDRAGAASAATNGFPWGTLYDAVGTAQAATNGISLASGLAAFRSTNGFDVAGSANAATNGFPWGVLYDAAGSATAATNGWPWGVLYDAAGAATAATNGISLASGLAAFRSTNTFDRAGAASSATNGYPWGVFYDPAGSATAATNGWPWGALYDTAGAAQAATNGISLASGLAAFRGTNTFASTNAATAATRGLVKVDNSTITVAADGTISATTGGGGSVTSIGLTLPGEFSVAGSPVTTSGTLAVTRTADANFLGFGATNVGFLKITNGVSIAGQAAISALVLTNGFTNQALTASTLLEADANKRVTSITNGAGALTNDASGNFGYAPLLDASALKASQYVATDGSTNLVSTQNGNNWTNTIAWTHDGTTTNVVASFNGTLQTFTVTNGPTMFLSYAGANGSVSYRIISTNFTTLQFSYQPKWLTGSNSVITNGVLSLTSYGGTNATQIEAAMKENQ
jgi:hypothetical protein